MTEAPAGRLVRVAAFAAGRRRLLLGLIGLACARPALGQKTADPDELKAAFLYHFASYVEWPQGRTDRPIVFAVAGNDGIERELRRLARGRRLNGRPIVVQTAEDAASAHVLFVAADAAGRLARYVEAIAGRPVLLVTETPGALERGSTINLVVTDRVQFEISVAAAARAGLRLSSRLLSLALRLKSGGSGPGPVVALA